MTDAIKDYIQAVKDEWTTEKVFEHFNWHTNGTQKEGKEVRLLGHGGLHINGNKWHTFAGDVGGGAVEAWHYCQHQRKIPNGEGMSVIYEMGDAAGIKRPSFSEEDEERYEERRNIEEILALSADYYHEELPEEQRAWLHTRYGLTDETIDNLKLGYAPASNNNLFAYLRKVHKISTEDLLKTGLFRQNDYGIQDAFQGRIMFPYWNRGRVVYFIGRETDETPEWEKERGMKYAKLLVHNENHPYVSREVNNSFFYGEDEIRGRDEVFITEGVTDCIIANQAGFPTVSPVTVSFRDDDHPKLIALLKDATRIYIVNDNEENESGKRGALATAAALWSAGKVVRFVELPRPEGSDKIDLNDFLRENTADDLRAILSSGKTLLDLRVEDVVKANPGEPKAAALSEVFGLIAQIDNGYILAQWRRELPKKLGVTKGEFDDFVEDATRKHKEAKAKQRRTGKDDAGTEEQESDRYVVRGGRICEMMERKDEDGNELPPAFVPLCNFDARINANVYRDNGMEKRLRLAISGTMYDNTPLPSAEIASEDYDQMRWVTEKWGGRPSIEPGGVRDTLRHAIQWLSEKDGIVDEYVYTHTGWRIINDRRVFLHAGGAVGMDGVAVELPERIRFYELPTDNAVDHVEAMRESIKLLGVSVPTVSYPLLAIAYSAPLSEIIKPAHMNWVEGSSGNLKTSFCSVIMNHYGKEFSDNCTPADWSGTGNSLEVLSFSAKDVMFLIDDFKPGGSKREADKMRDAASKIISDVGNRSGRSRLNSDSTLQQTYYPRGLVVSTAEKGAMGYSTNARMLTIPVEQRGPEGIDKDKLAVAQKQRHVYGYAMRGFIEYVAANWETLEKTLPNQLLDMRSEFSAPGHLRLPDAAAVLFVGFQVAMEYAVQIGAIQQAEMDEYCRNCKQVLMTIAAEQAQRVKSEDPALQYIQTVITLIGGQKAFVNGRADCANMGAGDLIGWHDTQTIYLMPSAYNMVYQYVAREGSNFPSDEKTLRLELIRQGYVNRVTKDRTNLQIKSPVTGTNERVIAISLEKFNEVALDMGINPLDLYSPIKKDNDEEGESEGESSKSAQPRVRLGHFSDPKFGTVDAPPDPFPSGSPPYLGNHADEPEAVTWTL